MDWLLGHPQPRALPPRQEVHLHFHGATEGMAAIIADVNRDCG